MNIQQMMKQAQQMQERMQKQMAELRVEATAGGGMVTVVLDGMKNLHRITIDPAAANTAAIRAYEKVGFRPVGVMRSYERGPDGTWHDGLLMELLAGEVREDPR